MKTNFVITKAMSQEELKGLEAYIYSKQHYIVSSAA
jgi:hypothetical protein